MGIEEQLREKLEKVEALYFGAGTAGERDAAGVARERLKAKLAEISRRDPPVEMQFSMPDAWAVRLFVALCRRYDIRPYRYPRQRRTTIMVSVHRGSSSTRSSGDNSPSFTQISGFISRRRPIG